MSAPVLMLDPQVPPKVLAGGDVNITLPQNAVILNGSGSYDDFGIVSYKWVRSESSPAAGVSHALSPWSHDQPLPLVAAGIKWIREQGHVDVIRPCGGHLQIHPHYSQYTACVSFRRRHYSSLSRPFG